ncbi:MAG: hypothetical protein R3C14_28495 [Caldilineaceae bacterium]
MIPVAPSLIIRPLLAEELPFIRLAVNRLLQRAQLSRTMDEDAAAAQFLRPNPPSLYPVRWQHVQRLCAWRAGELEGFVDVAIGFDQASLDEPEYRPIGLLRFLVLPEKPELLEEVATGLLQHSEAFWRRGSVGYIKAFHMSTGYPEFQAGLGVLPGDWTEHIRILTADGYQFSERFYCLRRALDQPLEETMPDARVSLLLRAASGASLQSDRHYQLYRHTEWIGQARVTSLTIPAGGRMVRLANLVDLQIVPAWRSRDIGKWLLRRLINDAILQGFHQMIVHVPNGAIAALNLFMQMGFEEENYRGYSLEKALTT